MKKAAFIVAVLSLIASCTIQKRTFNSGYYVSWNHSTKGKPAQSAVSPENIVSISEEPVALDAATVALDTETNGEAVSDIEIPTIGNGTPANPRTTPDPEPLQRPSAGKVEKVKESSEILTASEVKKIPNKKRSADYHAGGGGKSQIVALILCILLGLIGVHRFYLGYTGLGILYLFTLGLFGIGWLIDLILLIIPNGLTPKGKSSYRE